MERAAPLIEMSCCRNWESIRQAKAASYVEPSSVPLTLAVLGRLIAGSLKAQAKA